MKRKCLFCEEIATTKEHVWPRWILNLMQDRRPVRQKLGTRPEVTYKGDFTIRGVCSSCNNTWMSELETELKPILGPLLQDISIQLDFEDQKKIAKWAFKTAIVLEGTKPQSVERYFDSGLAPALKNRGAILGRTMIWIGRYIESGLFASAADITYNLNGQNLSGQATVTTMVVGYVLLQVVSAVFPPDADNQNIQIPLRTDQWDEIFYQIWPSTQIFVWPPKTTISSGGRFSLDYVRDRWKVLAVTSDPASKT